MMITLFLGNRIKTFKVGQEFITKITVYQELNSVIIDYEQDGVMSQVDYHNIGWTLGEEKFL